MSTTFTTSEIRFIIQGDITQVYAKLQPGNIWKHKTMPTPPAVLDDILIDSVATDWTDWTTHAPP